MPAFFNSVHMTYWSCSTIKHNWALLNIYEIMYLFRYVNKYTFITDIYLILLFRNDKFVHLNFSVIETTINNVFSL